MTASTDYVLSAQPAVAYEVLEEVVRARGVFAVEPDPRHLRLTFRPRTRAAGPAAVARCAVVDAGHGLSKLIGVWSGADGLAVAEVISLGSIFVEVDRRLRELEPRDDIEAGGRGPGSAQADRRELTR